MAKSKIEKSIEEEKKEYYKDNINMLTDNINNTLDTLDNNSMDSFFPPDNMLKTLDMDIVIHNYETDLELFKSESKETLECLANLYITEDMMKNKNINSIISNDAKALSDLQFTIECAKRGLISCSKQIDMGVNDPEMHMSLTSYIKEIRDVTKMAYELQKKMKDFYKSLKEELSDINIGEGRVDNKVVEEKGEELFLTDNKSLNNIIDEKIKGSTFIEQKS